MKTKEKLVTYSLQTTAANGKITDRLLRRTPSVYLRFAFNIENEIPGYYSREVFELIPYISKLEETGSAELKKWRKREVTEKIRRYLQLQLHVLNADCVRSTGFQLEVLDNDSKKECFVNREEKNGVLYYRRASLHYMSL